MLILKDADQSAYAFKPELIATDENLKGWYWKNLDTYVHYFRSELESQLGWIEKDEWKVVPVKPGFVQYLPHRYFTRHTRDGAKMTGREFLDHETALSS